MNLTLASFKYFSNWDNANINGFAMPINVKCQSPESGKHFVWDLVNVLDYHPKCECDLIKSHEKWQEAVLSFQHPWKHDSELLAKVIKISMDTLNLTELWPCKLCILIHTTSEKSQYQIYATESFLPDKTLITTQANIFLVIQNSTSSNKTDHTNLGLVLTWHNMDSCLSLVVCHTKKLFKNTHNSKTS